jgi:hypothetical protein
VHYGRYTLEETVGIMAVMEVAEVDLMVEVTLTTGRDELKRVAMIEGEGAVNSVLKEVY